MKKFLTLIVLIFPLLATAQQTRTISGQVLDRADGAPLIGATVFIAPEETQAKDYNPQGTIAYEQGRFEFKLPVSVKKVVISYLGYEAQTLDISGKSNFTIYLSATDNKVDAVVVTGYQRIEKRKLTSSISNVKMSDIARDGVASVDEMLSGSIAGLTSTPTTGAPGGASKIKIRSTVTLNGNTDPLWVLDGMPLEGNDIPADWSSKESIDNLYNMSIAGLNPADIEDITVLKDAGATAIYGARAANGVIVITTKKGTRNQATRVNVSASLFVTDRPNLEKLNLMNASQKVDFELGLASNGRLNHQPGMGGVARILDQAGERAALREGGFASLSPETQSAINALRKDGTDWGKEIYQVALNQQYSFSISGGGNKASYYLSGGYYNEQGTTIGTGFERLNLTMKTDYDLLKNLRFGASIFVGQNKNDSYVSDTDVFTNPSRYSRTVNPYLNAFDANGDYIYDPDMNAYQGNDDTILDFNFLEERERTEYMLKTRSIKTIFDLDYKPVKGLRLYTQFGLQVDNSMTEKMAQENTFFTRKYAYGSRISGVEYLPKGGVIQNWDGDLSQYTWKAQAEYTGVFGKHELDLMGGLEMRGTTNTTIHTKGFGYDHKTMTTKPINFPQGNNIINDARFKQYQKSFYENRYLSYFFTASYTFDNRYTFFGSMRYDGTNLFGVDPKYKFNPMWSVSGAWNINREQFLRDARWLDNLRLRASYGVQGNIDRTTSPYILGTWNNASIGGLTEDRIDVSSPPNQNLRWETTYSWNTALDFSALDNRLGFTFELYGRRSKDLITNRSIPLETGFASTSTNYGEISSRGVEFTLNTVNVRTRDFRWETSFNIAHNTDKVEKVRLDDNSWTPSLEGYSSSAVFAFKTAGLDEMGIPMFWKDGQKVSLQEFVGFRYEMTDPWGLGIPELYQFSPVMNNSLSSVRNSLSYIGSRNPDVTGGFNNRFYYKNFDLAISCNFVFGQLVTRTPFYDPTQTGPGQNYTTEMNQVWSPENTSGIYPVIVGSRQPDGSAWGDWSEDSDPYRIMYWIMDSYPTNVGLFRNLDIWSRKINYFRVNSIRLGYAFPEKITRKLHMAGLRVHFEARNPFVIATNYDGYFDPETYGNIYAQPLARTYSVGLNITF